MLEWILHVCSQELRGLNIVVEMGLMYSCSVHNYTWGNTFDKKAIVIYQCLSEHLSCYHAAAHEPLDLYSDCQ